MANSKIPSPSVHKKPPVGDEAAAVSDEADAVSDEAAAVSDEAAAVSNEAAAVGDEATAIDDQKAAVGREKATVGHKKVAVGHKKATADHEKVAADQDLASRVPVQWAFGICAIVILAALGNAIFVTFIRNASDLQARIAIISIFFAITCVLSLLFLTTTAKTQVGGKIAVLSLSIGGPAAFFIACLVIYDYFHPDRSAQMKDPMTIKTFSDIVSSVEKETGWSTFTQWRSSLGNLQFLFNRDEELNLQHLLSFVYYRGVEQRKLKNPLIQIAFIFGPTLSDGTNKILKLERIVGSKIQDVASVYFSAKGGTSEAKPRAVLFVRHSTDQVVPTSSRDRSWVDIADDPVECFALAEYSGEKVPEGDMAAVDIAKYFSVEDKEGATVDFALLSPIPRVGARLWQLRATETTGQNDPPLLFRELSLSAQDGAGNMLTDRNFNWWLDWLDKKAVESTAEVREFVNSVLLDLRTISPDITFANCLTHSGLGVKTSYHLTKLTDPFLVTFLWGVLPAPSHSKSDNRSASESTVAQPAQATSAQPAQATSAQPTQAASAQPAQAASAQPASAQTPSAQAASAQPIQTPSAQHGSKGHRQHKTTSE